jgi:hypothetical protein
LDDRIIFLGESNGDHMLWNTNHGAVFWGERQAFLLGCKLDWIQRPDAGGSNNPAVLAIVDAWWRSGFWDRRPVYDDSVGLTDVPVGVDVRRFTGNSGETLLAIDNTAGVQSVTLTVDGRLVTLRPNGWLSTSRFYRTDRVGVRESSVRSLGHCHIPHDCQGSGQPVARTPGSDLHSRILHAVSQTGFVRTSRGPTIAVSF